MSTTVTRIDEWPGDFNPLSDAVEKRVLLAALDSFKNFRQVAHFNVTHHRRQSLYALRTSQWQMLAEPPFSLLQNLSDVDDAIDCNADIADAIFQSGFQAFGLSQEPEFQDAQNWKAGAKAGDFDKAHSTIRQFYRDWSAEGVHERKPCYDFILQQLRVFLQSGHKSEEEKTSRYRILVPGAGLGRLVYEICRAGYDAEGNEFSYHQLLASSWMFNHVGATPYPLYPFAAQFTNLRSREQQLRKVLIPDVHPAEGVNQALSSGSDTGEMSMTAGDFVLSYSSQKSKDTFDAIATMFFIDTAPNVLRYIDTVSNCLKADGVWINVGPLLWHSDVALNGNAHEGHGHKSEDGDADRDTGVGEPGSFELTEQEVIWLLERRGYRIEHREIWPDGLGYIQNPDSMFQNLYRVSSWVARKTK